MKKLFLFLLLLMGVTLAAHARTTAEITATVRRSMLADMSDADRARAARYSDAEWTAFLRSKLKESAVEIDNERIYSWVEISDDRYQIFFVFRQLHISRSQTLSYTEVEEMLRNALSIASAQDDDDDFSLVDFLVAADMKLVANIFDSRVKWRGTGTYSPERMSHWIP